MSVMSTYCVPDTIPSPVDMLTNKPYISPAAKSLHSDVFLERSNFIDSFCCALPPFFSSVSKQCEIYTYETSSEHGKGVRF